MPIDTRASLIESTCALPQHSRFATTLRLLLESEGADPSPNGIANSAKLAESLWRQALGEAHAMLGMQRRFAGFED